MEKVANKTATKKVTRKTAAKKAVKLTLKGGAGNSLLNSMVETSNLTATSNGAKTFKSTLNSVLDLFAMGGALRTRGESDIVQLFVRANAEDQLLALKCLFHIRNVRGGAGERRTFRIILKYLGQNYPAVIAKNLGNIVHFGRFDDLYELFDTRSEKDAMNFMAATLEDDLNKMENKEKVSLAAKWTASENASSAKTKERATKFRKFLGVTERTYRKSLSALRSYSNVLEVAMSNRDWNSIDYSKIPSKAGLSYRNAFKKHDPTGYQSFLDGVAKGEKKINASALFPYEILEKVRVNRYGDNQTADALWNALPDYMGDKSRNLLVMADVSGSMLGRPMDVSVSLAIYTAERNVGPFGGYFITYSGNPTLQKVVGNTLSEKYNCLLKTCAYNTDLQKAFKMVLDHAVKIKAKSEDLPAQILVISDMEFDSTQHGETNLEAIGVQYRNAGYEMPQLVFWNVNSTKNNVAAKADTKGVILVSGCSPSVFKTLLSGTMVTPQDQMLETLNGPDYERVVI